MLTSSYNKNSQPSKLVKLFKYILEMVNFSSKIIYLVDYKVFKHFQIVKVYTLNLVTVLNIYAILVAEMYKTFLW